ncbi:MAG: DUF1667 domain-containing protein [Elusimicrobia bacterium]|nr:DUF1667 domain-containing protein [Elusimicrobiota bacterium]
MNRLMICIECPQGCRLSVETGGSRVISVTGQECECGENYARQEIENPVRTLTASVLTGSPALKMLPVRTSAPIPKEKIFPAMEEIKKIKVPFPVETGDAVVKNFMGLGVDLLATRKSGRSFP